jgi:hypothetical protein
MDRDSLLGSKHLFNTQHNTATGRPARRKRKRLLETEKAAFKHDRERKAPNKLPGKPALVVVGPRAVDDPEKHALLVVENA